MTFIAVFAMVLCFCVLTAFCLWSAGSAHERSAAIPHSLGRLRFWRDAVGPHQRHEAMAAFVSDTGRASTRQQETIGTAAEPTCRRWAVAHHAALLGARSG